MKWLLAGFAMLSCGIAAESGVVMFRFGNFEVTAVQDAVSKMRKELFPGISDTEFRKLAGDLQAPSSVNVFLLKHDGKLILIDAGNGGERGTMLRKIKALGISPEKIDFILLTHIHGDHIGGLLDGEGKAVFPAATVFVAAPEREYWQSDAAGARGELARKVFRTYGDRVKSFRFGEEVVPGIRALDASGHTPGHTVFETDSLLIVGDLLHAGAIQFPRPELSATYDMEPEKAARIRKQFYDLAAAASKPVAGMHLPFPGIGRISHDTAGYIFSAEKPR